MWHFFPLFLVAVSRCIISRLMETYLLTAAWSGALLYGDSLDSLYRVKLKMTLKLSNMCDTELQKRCTFSQSALNKQLLHLISTWFAVRGRADLVSARIELSLEARRQQQSHGASGSVGNRRFPNCAVSQSPTRHNRLYNLPNNATFPTRQVDLSLKLIFHFHSLCLCRFGRLFTFCVLLTV